MANRYDGEVAAPEFGEGYTIRLDVRGQGELETEFGAFEFAGKVGLGLAVMSTAYLVPFLKASLRKDGERVAELPELPAPLAPIAEHCLDAFALFRYGKRHAEWIADNENLAAARKPRANPTRGTKASPAG